MDELRDLYDAEKQLTKALPKMAKAAESEQLSAAISEHLEVTKNQAQRIEEMFEALGGKARSKPCKGMKGIVEEGQEHISENEGTEFIDSVLIGGGRKIEHYEIAGYTGALELAQSAGLHQVARLIKQTLAEEERMDKKLAQLSSRVLKQAMKEAA